MVGHYKEAGSLLSKCLQIRRVVLGQKHPSVAQSLWALGELTRSSGYPMRAEEYYDQALLIREEVFGHIFDKTNALLLEDPNRHIYHRSIVDSLFSAALNQELFGDYNAALETCTDAIRKSQAVLALIPGMQSAPQTSTPIIGFSLSTVDIETDNDYHLKLTAYTANMQITLSRLYLELNKLSEAKSCLSKCGGVIHGALGSKHLLTADVYRILGLICNQEAQYTDAHHAYVRGCTIVCEIMHDVNSRKKDAGINIDTYLSENIFHDKSEAERKEQFHMHFDEGQFADVDDKRNDVQHPLYAEMLHAMSYNLGVHGPGYLKEAMDFANRGYEISYNLFGHVSSSSGTLATEITASRMSPTNKGGLSSPSNKNMDGGSHPIIVLSIAKFLYLKARLFTIKRDWKHADSCFADALDAILFMVGEKSALYTEAFGDYGAYIASKANANNDFALYSDADEILSHNLMSRRQTFGDNHHLVADAMQYIALLLIYRGQIEEALALMKDGVLPGLEASLGNKHPKTLYVGGCVGSCLVAVAQMERGEMSEQHQKMYSSGLEIIKSALNFLRQYPQGKFVPDHPWVRQIGTYKFLTNPKNSIAEEGGTDTTAAKNDHEIQMIKDEIKDIPMSSHRGLVYKAEKSKCTKLYEVWEHQSK
jgi:tetratricopeptide (TPR) repeat protein